MSFDLHALLDLWTQLPADDSEAVEAFRRLYTDPVRVNGATLSASDLVVRARSLQHALDQVHREVIEVCDAGTKVAVAFHLEGRHVGPLATSAGVLQPTGRTLSLRVIDVLSVADGKITAVTMVADELGALAAVDAVALVS
jgi:ketosteroid isomerase-like protein